MPSYTTSQFVYSNAFLDNVCSRYASSAASALISTCSIDLWTNPAGNPAPGSVSGDFTNAAFTGYSTQTSSLVQPINVSLTGQGVLAAATFVASGSTSGATCYGYKVTTGGTLVGAEKFASGATFVFGSSGDWLDLQVVMPLGNYQSNS